MTPEQYLALMTMHGNDYGFHGVDHGAAVRVRKLLPAHSNRRGRHGVPSVNMLSFWTRSCRWVVMIARVFRRRWRSDWRVDVLSYVERAGRNSRPRAGSRRDSLIVGLAIFCGASLMGALNFITTLIDLRAKRHDARAPAADVLDVF